MNQPNYKVPNLDRALSLLELLKEHPGGLTVSEIAKLMDIPVNSAFRISMTMLDRGYFIRSGKSKRFRMSRKLLSLASAAASEQDLLTLAIGPMRELRDEVKETVLLGTLIPGEARGVAIEQVPGLHPFKFLLDVGTNLVLHVGAPGKCFLAYLPEDERKEIMSRLKLTRYTKNTITTKAALKKELELTRQCGYGTDHGEWMEEMHCVGAPILDQYAYPVGALWITGPSTRLKERHFKSLGQTVAAYAERISQCLRDEKV